MLFNKDAHQIETIQSDSFDWPYSNRIVALMQHSIMIIISQLRLSISQLLNGKTKINKA